MAASPRFQKLVAAIKPHITEITATDALERHASGAILVDVREADEYEKGYALDAIHLARGVLEMKIEEAVPDLATPIVCYCGGGNRSALAVENLQRMGYSNVASMAGGFKDWKERGLPTS